MQLYNKIQENKYGMEYDMLAANFLMNSTASLLDGRTNRKEEERLRKQSNLDQFIETPYDRYAYESYSNSPYMKDGGMIGSMRHKKKGIFNQDLYQESRSVAPKHKPNLGLNDFMGMTPQQAMVFKDGGLYTRDREAYINSSNVTMRGINSPVLGFPDIGDPVLMMPGKEYNFPNARGVREHKFQEGGFWQGNQEEEVYDTTSKNKEMLKSARTRRPLPQPIKTPRNIADLKPIRGTKGKRNSGGTTIKEGLVKRGFSNDEAAAITGNIYAESAFNSKAVNPSSKAFGLMQWLGDRKRKLHSKYGDNPTTENQLDYIAWELQGGNKYESNQFAKAMRGKTLEEKTYGFAKHVERPSPREIEQSIQKRQNYAATYQ